MPDDTTEEIIEQEPPVDIGEEEGMVKTLEEMDAEIEALGARIEVIEGIDHEGEKNALQGQIEALEGRVALAETTYKQGIATLREDIKSILYGD